MKHALVVEIKSSRNPNSRELLEDLQKLEMFTDPHEGLGFKIGIMLVVNSDFENLFARASDDLKKEISETLNKGPRVAIWNISSPIPWVDGNSGDGRLNRECLKIFRASDVSKLAAPPFVKDRSS